MSCGNIKLINYPKLTKVIEDNVGLDVVKKANYLSMIRNEDFQARLKDAKIFDIESNPEGAFDILVKTYDELVGQTSQRRFSSSENDLGKFDSFDAKNEAANYMAKRIFTIYSNAIVRNDSTDIIKIYNTLLQSELKAIKNKVKEYSGEDFALFEKLVNDPNSGIIIPARVEKVEERYVDRKGNLKVKEVEKKYKAQINHDKFFNRLITFVEQKIVNNPKNKTSKADKTRLQNRLNILYSMIYDENFRTFVMMKKDVGSIFNASDINDLDRYNDYGGFLTEADVTKTEDGRSDVDDSTDFSGALWNLNIGEYTSFEKHISELIKYQLKSVYQCDLIDNDTPGKSVPKFNDTFGTVEYIDDTYIKKLLFLDTNKTNVSAFVESIKDIANKYNNAKGLIFLYDKLKKDSILANQYFMTFSAPIIKKTEVVLNNQDAQNRQSNRSISRRDVILYNLTYGLSGSTTLSFEELEADRASLNDTYSAASAYKAKALFSKYFSFVNEFERDKMYGPITKATYKNIADDIRKYISLIEKIKKRKQDKLNAYYALPREQRNSFDWGNYYENGDITELYKFVDKFEKFIDSRVSLNSRNSAGNLSSDAINNSYITYFNNIIQGAFNQEALAKFANQKFRSNQYKYNNLLVEHTSNGRIINYGLFGAPSPTATLTRYSPKVFDLSLFSGIANRQNGSNSVYASMTDNDYFISALGMFAESRDFINIKEGEEIVMAKYFLPIPSDAPKNFVVRAPMYSTVGLINDGLVNQNHPIFQMFVNMVKSELADMGTAASRLFELDAEGRIRRNEDGSPVMSKLYNENPDAFYDVYHHKNGAIYKDGKLLGSVFEFKRIKSDYTPRANAKFNALLGNGIISFLTGNENRAKIVDNEVQLNQAQRNAVYDAISTFIIEYTTNATNALTREYSDVIQAVYGKEKDNSKMPALDAFLLNDYIVSDSVYDLLGGNNSFYKKPIDILKRTKQMQASGHLYGGADFNVNDIDAKTDVTPLSIKIGSEVKPITINHNGTREQISLRTKFTGAMISNTVGPLNKNSIANIKRQLKGVDSETVDRLLKPFVQDDIAHNDAQSYITLDEWIRRIALAGELQQYATLIDALTNDTPAEDIDWSQFNQKVQVQKNFYFDLHYDPVVGREVPRQIKNAEYVIIPKFVQGTDLEQLYNLMVENSIDQINTVETVKVAKHNKLTYWDNDGDVVKGKKLTKFKNDLSTRKEDFSYNFLYRQQDAHDHVKDERNKMAVQIIKKIIDNVTSQEGIKLRGNILNNYALSIYKSCKELADELDVAIDENGNFKLDEYGNIEVSVKTLFERMARQAVAQDADESILDFFETDMNGIPKLPVYLSSIAPKIESMINGMFNNAITRQTIAGTHLAQVSDFGFREIYRKDKTGKIKADKKLSYRKEVELDVDGKKQKIYVVEVRMPRWSKALKDKSIKDLTLEERLMIGYRIPTEGKQSMAIFEVVEFLDDAEGSTIVVPDGWVPQTGSDFDIDSIYTINKTFRRNNDGSLKVYKKEDYVANDYNSYLTYLMTNSEGIIRKNLKRFAGNRDINVIATEQTSDYARGLIEATSDEANIDIAYLNKLATQYGAPTYEEYIKMPLEERVSREAINNELATDFIKILSDKSVVEEALTTSNFENLKDAKEDFEAEFKETSRIISPSDFMTKLRWFTAATSGIRLKGISVNLDTFNSISNVVKGTFDGIDVVYDGKKYSKLELQETFGVNKVKEFGDDFIVTHDKIGWSLNNRNVDGYMINPYSSQTTAHILDVMKAGAVHNENTYTMFAFKLLPSIGSNFETAVGLMYQPGVDDIVKEWSKTQSVASDDSSNPIFSALRKYVKKLYPKANAFSRNDMLKLLDREDTWYDKEFDTLDDAENYKSENDKLLGGRVVELKNGKYKIVYNSFRYKYGFLPSEMFGDRLMSVPMDVREYRKRQSMNPEDKNTIWHDIITIGQFYALNFYGNKINDYYNVLKTDGYGAKQTFVDTYETLDKISELIDDYYIRTLDGTSFIESVFPISRTQGNIIQRFANMDTTKSSYPTLASFAKYASAFSLAVGKNITPTADPSFLNYVLSIKDYINTRVDSKTLIDFEKEILNSFVIGEDGSPYVNLPVTVNPTTGEVSVTVNNTNSDTLFAARFAEIHRLIGSALAYSDVNKVVINDWINPTQEEVNEFAKLSPAQKIVWIKTYTTHRGAITQIDTNLTDDNRQGVESVLHWLRYNNTDDSMDSIKKLFKKDLLNTNPLIRLAAIDVIKYNYLIEGDKYSVNSVNKMIDNVALEGEDAGGLVIGDMANYALGKFIGSNIYDGQHNIELQENLLLSVVGFARRNYDSFPARTVNFTKMEDARLEVIDNTPCYTTASENDFDLDSFTGNLDNNITFSRSGKILYLTITDEYYRKLYIPLNRLSSFEYGRSFSNSSLDSNNVFKDVGEVLYNFIYSSNYHGTSKLVRGFVEQVYNLDNKVRTLPTSFLEDTEQYPVLTRTIPKANAIYKVVSRKKDVETTTYIMALDAKNFYEDNPAINLGLKYTKEEVKEKLSNYNLIKDYPGIDLDDVTIFTKIDEKLFNENDEFIEDELESAIDETTPIGRTIKNIGVLIDADARSGNSNAQKVLNAFNRYEINLVDTESLYEQKDLSIEYISNYIEAEAYQLLNDIKRFMIIGIDPAGKEIYGNIKDPEVLNKVMEDVHLQDRFLKVIANARVLKDKYSDYINLDVSEFDDRVKDLIQRVKEVIQQVSNNTDTIVARNNWLNRYIATHSNNPNIQFGTMSALDMYGDTSIMDYWFQDLRANKSAIVQVILEDVSTRIEEGRLDGIQRFHEFENYIAVTEEAARKEGLLGETESIIDSVVDKDGKFKTTHNEKLTEDYNKLLDEFNIAKKFHGKDSIEYIVAKHKLEAFQSRYFESETKPKTFELDKATGNVTLTYKRALNLAERSMLFNPDGTPSSARGIYMEYKKIMNAIYEIYKNAPNNVLTESQEEELDKLYAQLGELRKVEYFNPETGERHTKSAEEQKNIIILNTYIDRIRNIKNAFISKKVKDGFYTTLKEKLDIINSFEVKNAKGEVVNDISELLKIPKYKEAKDWIKNNTMYIPSSSLLNAVMSAYNTLRTEQSMITPKNPAALLLNVPAYYDAQGQYNGIAITASIPNISRKVRDFVIDSYSRKASDGTPFGGFIKAIEEDTNIYRQEFWDNLIDKTKPSPTIKTDVSVKINNILAKHYDPSTKFLHIQDLTLDELKELAEYTSKLAAINKYNKGIFAKDVAEFIENECKVLVNYSKWSDDYDAAKAKGKEYQNAFEQAFGARDTDGYLTFDGTDVDPGSIYETITPINPDKWIDKAKTEAREFLNKHVVKSLTSYYWQARQEAYNKGAAEYEAWFNDNHYYDPNSKQIVPLFFWYKQEYLNDEGEVDANYEPAYRQMENELDESVINPNYTRFNKTQYIYGTNPDYDNKEYGNLNKYQLEVINKLKEIMQDYAWSNSDRYFVAKGYLPSIAMAKPLDAKSFVKETFSAIGFSSDAPTDMNFKNLSDVTIDKDYEISNEYLHRLVDRFTEEKTPIPEKQEGETEEQYRTRYNEAVEHNRKIDEENTKAHAAILSHNWNEVFEALIVKGQRYNAVRLMKSLLFTLDQTILDNPAYSLKGGKMSVNKRMSNDDNMMYRTEINENLSKQIRTYINRIVYNKYRDAAPKTWTNIGTLAASVSGTKYMMMNITGGIQNVLTGGVNILMERFAKEYTDTASWEKAKLQWMESIPDYFVHLYDNKAGNLTNGIIKLLNVVDFDRLVEINTVEGTRLAFKRVRNAMFAPQNMGEHFMQNTMMLSMMKTHKLIRQADGKVVIQSKNSYIQQNELELLREVIGDDTAKQRELDEFIENIKNNKLVSYKYNTFKNNIIYDFNRTLSLAKQREFIKKRKKLIKEKAKEFDNFKDDVYSQFELKDGYAVIKEGSELTNHELGKFVDKVKEVNKKIHGVYDRLGAANIERHWWGAAVMQFHKHLYPGFKKHFRWNGYYNEALDTIEKGMYKSLYDFLSLPIREAYEENKDSETAALAGIKNYFIHTLKFIQFLRTNYQLLPENEKANIRRVWAEQCGILAAIVIGIAAAGLADDDDDNILFNLGIYHADRLATETWAYTPWGAINEFKTLYSSPVAFFSSITDAAKVMSYGVGMLLDGGFDEKFRTGRYAGRNKLEVYITRNIPVYRGIERVLTIDKNNKYYKLDKNILSFINYDYIKDTGFDGVLGELFD